MDKTKKCPKCKGDMKEGNYTGAEVNWEKEEGPAYLKKTGRKIITYACNKCGYIESYVRQSSNQQ